MTDTCPLCQQSNRCTGDSHCWCMDVDIDSDALKRIPEADRDRRCLCPRCALGTDAGKPSDLTES